MERERWQAVKACVGRAMEQAPTVRASWLHAACGGDLELLANAETLLKAAGFTGSLLSVSSTFDSSGSADDSIAKSTARRQSLGTVGHYELRNWLGAGGMGEVFLARDLALGRDVALKLLPRRFTPELRVRLMGEAAASAKVQHPAIATFYEAGEADGEAFIAMEYVKGQTLRQRLAEGAMSVSECLAIARCLLEALEHAHAAGILHRDIKPENVMVTSSRGAKLLDFGLAKHLLAAPQSCAAPAGFGAITLATDTRLAGTIGYMAPEQFLEDSLDERTDVFQVGAVLYEMLSGRPAFGGSSPLDRLTAIMMREPDFEALQGLGLPSGVHAVLRRALARDRSTRHPTAAALLRDIEDVADGRVVTELPKVIAVLDFENATDEAETSWIGSAVADAVRVSLARLEGLTVVSRDKALATIDASKKGGAADPVAVGLRLGCGWVVSGSVQRVDASVTVTAQLIEVSTARVAASEVLDGPSDDLFGVHDALAKAMASSLGYSASAVVSPRTTIDVQECLTRAQLLLDRLDKGAVEQARELLERALAIDGNYAPVLAALANAYGFRSIAKPDPGDVERALHFASRAIEVDPGSADAHMWRGYALLRQNRLAEAAVAHTRASELDRANASAPYFAGCSLLFFGQRDDALPLLQRALDLDSRSGMAWLALGVTHLCLERLDQARYAFTRARETEAHPARYPCAGAAAYVGEVMRLEGQAAAARAHALAGIESAERSDHAYRDTFRAYALVVFGRSALDEGDRAAARAAFQQVLSQGRGRPRTRSCGHLVVEALAGLARTDHDANQFAEACSLFEGRTMFNFEPFFGMLDDLTLFDLACTAGTLGFHDEAHTLHHRACEAGSRRVLPTS